MATPPANASTPFLPALGRVDPRPMVPVRPLSRRHTSPTTGASSPFPAIGQAAQPRGARVTQSAIALPLPVRPLSRMPALSGAPAVIEVPSHLPPLGPTVHAPSLGVAGPAGAVADEHARYKQVLIELAKSLVGIHPLDAVVVLDPALVCEALTKEAGKANREFTDEPIPDVTLPPDHPARRSVAAALALGRGEPASVSRTRPEIHASEIRGSFVAHSQGHRDEMEDALGVAAQDGILITWVCDGHGAPPDGHLAVNYAARHLPKLLLELLAQRPDPESPMYDVFMWNVLSLAPVVIHQRGKASRETGRLSGTTAIVAIQVDGQLWVLNVGDSRAVLFDPKTGKITPLSRDAKPSPGDEEVTARGGIVRSGRVESRRGDSVAVKRAIGDVAIPGMSARATVVRVPISPGQVLLQHCDGVSEQMVERVLAGRVLAMLRVDTGALGEMARLIVDAALASGSKDNLTAMLTVCGNVPHGTFCEAMLAPVPKPALPPVEIDWSLFGAVDDKLTDSDDKLTDSGDAD